MKRNNGAFLPYSMQSSAILDNPFGIKKLICVNMEAKETQKNQMS